MRLALLVACGGVAAGWVSQWTTMRPSVVAWGGKPKRKKMSAWDREEQRAVAAWEKKQVARTKTTSPKPPPSEVRPVVEDKAPVAPRVVRSKRRLRADDIVSAEMVGSFDEVSAMPDWATPEVAFLGRSNVGKSSMLNALVGSRKAVAIASKRPGRTRRINVFRVRDGRGTTCALTDLPGYGYAALAKDEQAAIAGFVEGYLDCRSQLKLVVLIVDARRRPEEVTADLGVLDALRARDVPVVVVATKMDKFQDGAELMDRLRDIHRSLGLPHDQPYYFSALTRQGRPELWSLLNDYITSETPPDVVEHDDGPIDESVFAEDAGFVILERHDDDDDPSRDDDSRSDDDDDVIAF